MWPNDWLLHVCWESTCSLPACPAALTDWASPSPLVIAHNDQVYIKCEFSCWPCHIGSVTAWQQEELMGNMSFIWATGTILDAIQYTFMCRVSTKPHSGTPWEPVVFRLLKEIRLEVYGAYYFCLKENLLLNNYRFIGSCKDGMK